MHQQRVLAHINQRKREAMTCYTQALTEQPPNVSRTPLDLSLPLPLHAPPATPKDCLANLVFIGIHR